MSGPTVEFRTGLADVLGHAVGWLRQAAARRVRVRVAGPPPQLKALDARLWTAQPGDFIAHAATRADGDYPPGFAHTPIWLGEDAALGAAPEVLVSLGSDACVTGYARVIELVGQTPQDIAQGRERWRWYMSQGLTPTLKA